MTKVLSQRALTIPKKLIFGIISFLIANLCIIIFNIHNIPMISFYGLFCALYYFTIYSSHGIGKIIYVFLLLFTLSYSLVEMTSLSTTVHHTVIGSCGAFFSLLSSFLLFSKTSRRWVADRQLNIQSRTSKRQYTEKDFQQFAETLKNIPPSYRWGRWIFLLILILETVGLVVSIEKNGSNGIFWLMVTPTFDMIGLIGLLWISARLLNWYAAYLYACFVFLAIGVSMMIVCFVLEKFNAIHFIHTTSPLNWRNAAILVPLSFIIIFLKCAIFYNKKSREWLKASRIAKKMLAIQNAEMV